MIDLSEVGASVTKDGAGNYSLRFGIYLPGVRSGDGFKLLVRIIHQADRFNPLVNTVDAELTWQPGTQLDLWTATTPLQRDPDSHYGQNGIYLYRFQLWHKSSSDTPVTMWATDPFSYRTDVGLLAGVEFNPTPTTPFKWSEPTLYRSLAQKVLKTA